MTGVSFQIIHKLSKIGIILLLIALEKASVPLEKLNMHLIAGKNKLGLFIFALSSYH